MIGRRAREGDLQRVRVVGRTVSGGIGTTDIAVLGDQGEVRNVAGDHRHAGHARGDAGDGIELDVAAAGDLDAVGLCGGDRAVFRGGDTAEHEAVLAAEIDLGRRLGRDRGRVVEDHEALLRQGHVIGHDTGRRVGRGVDDELAGTGRGEQPLLRSRQRRGVDAGEGECLRRRELTDRAVRRVQHDLVGLDVGHGGVTDRRRRRTDGRRGHRVGELALRPLRARGDDAVDPLGRCQRVSIAGAVVARGQRHLQRGIGRHELLISGHAVEQLGEQGRRQRAAEQRSQRIGLRRAIQSGQRGPELIRADHAEQELVLQQARRRFDLHVRRRDGGRINAELRRHLRPQHRQPRRGRIVGAAVRESDVLELEVIVVGGRHH